ncbi:MAG: hypothetical protein E7521_01765 [Ruminococcaceae bacterium]|nr:hypothetical protein [Oscillospiraceae bacterium]
MKKIISILACVCLLLSVLVIPVAAETSATITFDDKAKRTVFDSSSHQVWEENGITVTNNKGTYANALGDYANPARFYAGTETIIEYPSMTKIEVTAVSAKYAQVWADSNTDANATVTVSDSVATIVFATAVDSYTVASMSAQSRVASLTVYAAAEAGACTHDATTLTSNGDETHSVVCDSCSETVSTADCEDVNLDGICDTCEGAVALPETLTIAEAAALGSEQADSAYTTEKYLVSGQITAVANTQYGNMYIADEEGNEIYIYGMYSADGSVSYDGLSEKPDEGDTVTVLSVVGNYRGTAQLKNAWLIEFEAGELAPTTPDPEADTALTIEEAIALGESKKSNVYTENKYYVTGTVTEVYNETYGNMYIADENGNTLTIYGTYSADGETAYADMETKPVAGDTITVYGIIGNYGGTAQMKNGWITEIAAEEETFEGTDPEAPIELAVNDTTPATLKEIKVPAGGTVFVKAADANGIFHVTSTTGTCMLINGRTNQVEISDAYDLTLCGYEMVNIYNSGEETVTLYVFLEAGAGEVFGTWDNPEVLELQENPWMPSFPPEANVQTELEAGNQGYFYTITAEKDGAFAFSITANDAEYNDVGYQLSVTNNTTSWQSDLIARAAGADDYYDTVMIPVKAGDELLINAGTFDAADMWNAPAGTLNVRVSFATIGSYEYPVVLEETGDYAATVEAGSQGYYYEWIVEADGTVTVTMNDEAGWQYNISKVPVDVDDYANYYNSDTHWYNDDPVVATETVDVKAGETIKVWVNTYDAADEWNPPAGTVNWTLSWSEKVSNPGVFSMADAEAYAGKEFTVAIDISNNPGIISAVLDVVYDKDVLELVKAEAGEFNNKTTSVGEEVDCYFFSEDFSRINWVDALAAENCTANGTFAILTFRVKEGATGETQISINFDADNVFNKDLENVEFTATGATITIKEGMPGDVNSDGSVDNKDYALLMQHLNNWDVEIDLGVADVNGDGSVDNKDYALLMQYLNNWDVVLK